MCRSKFAISNGEKIFSMNTATHFYGICGECEFFEIRQFFSASKGIPGLFVTLSADTFASEAVVLLYLHR